MSELDAATRRQLENELPTVYKRVLARAIAFANDKRVQAVLGGDAKKAAEELVQEAVVRTLRGCRKWNPEKVGLEHFLVQAARSIADSYKHRGSLRGPTYDDELGGTEVRNPGTNRESPPTPDELLAAKQAEAALENELIEAAGEDEDLLDLVEALLSGTLRPREMVPELGWDISKVNVVFRKLRRRMSQRQETAVRS